MLLRRRAVLALLAPVVVLAAPAPYRDPAGQFTLGPLPKGWSGGLQETDPGISASLFTSADGSTAIAVITAPIAAPVAEAQFEAEGAGAIDAVLGLFATRVVSREVRVAEFGPRRVVRCEFVVEVEGQGVRAGTAVAWFTGERAILGMASAARDDDAGRQAALAVLETLRLPGEAAPAAAGGLFDAGNLRGLAERIRGGADDADRVLAEGEPPLTVGSVKAFCDYVGYLFGIEFTQVEVALTEQRFVEYYRKADADGRRILAQGGASLLAQVRQSPEEEKAQLRRQMAAQFAAGAEQGIEWAAALHEAIGRRETRVAQTTAKPPAEAMRRSTEPEIDQDFSQADLTAAVELIYFMWVAGGHDPNAATPEVVAGLQSALVQNFAGFEPDFQAVLCNAERVYAAIRQRWEQGDDATRQAMAQQFNQVLAGLGLLDQGGGNGGGNGGGGDSNWEVTSGLVMNTCWNLAQRSTGGW